MEGFWSGICSDHRKPLIYVDIYMAKREFKDLEAKWQARWEAEGIYRAKDPGETKAEKFYGLIEFPYPSGDGLHVGHPRSYALIDAIVRKRRMEGQNVLYPIGWDA